MADSKPIRRNRSTNHDIIQLTYWMAGNRQRYDDKPTTAKQIARHYREETGTDATDRLATTVAEALGVPLKSPRRRRRRYKGQTPRLDRLIIEVVHLSKKLNALYSAVMDTDDPGLSEGLQTLYERKADPNGRCEDESDSGSAEDEDGFNPSMGAQGDWEAAVEEQQEGFEQNL